VEVDVVSLAAEFPNDNPELHRGVSWVCLDVTGLPVAIPPEPEPEPMAVVVIEPEIITAVTIVEPAPASMSVAELLAAPEPEVVEVNDVIEAVEPEPVVIDEPPVPEPRISGIVARGAVHDLDDEDDDAADIVVEELPPLDESASVEGATMMVAPPAPSALPALAAPPALVETSTSLPPASDDPFTVLVSTLADVAIGAGSPYVASLLPGLLLEGRLDHSMAADAAVALAEADIARGTEVTATFIGQTRAWRAMLAGTSDDFAACGNAMLDEWAAELLARLLGAPSKATALRRELRSRGVAAFGLVEAA
jgi:hypothetical protein